MIDTGTLFEELAKLFRLNKNDFFCRVSMAQYLESSFGKHGLPWNWMAKIGIKDNSLAIRLTSLGVKERAELLNPKFSKKISRMYKLNNNHVGKDLFLLLNSYDQYLNQKMHPLVMKVNKYNK